MKPANHTYFFSAVDDVESYIVTLAEVGTQSTDGLVWFEALPAKTWHTAAYGEVPVTEQKLNNFVKNFHDNVRGQEIATNYNHGRDVAKGDKASGWIRDARVMDGSLHLGVDFTEVAKNELKNKEWKYFSLEWKDSWTHPETNIKHSDVMVGGALTNTPVAKGMVPINFSEFFDPVEFADWSTAYKDALPNSAFMYVDGKGQRHFPYKDSTGKVDVPHLEAIVRLAPRAGLPQDVIDRVVNRAKKMLGKSMSEGGENMTEEEKRLRKLLGLAEDAENDAVEAAITKLSEDLTASTEEVKSLTTEITPLRKAIADNTAKKAFAEQFPEEAKRMEEMERDNRALKSTSFAERFSLVRFKDVKIKEDGTKELSEDGKLQYVNTNKGLSSLAIETIKDTHLKFAEGTATETDLVNLLDTIFEGGIVEYGERGTSGPGSSEGDLDPNGDVVTGNLREDRVAFSEKVTLEMGLDKDLSLEEATAKASKKFPKLAEAYARVI